MLITLAIGKVFFPLFSSLFHCSLIISWLSQCCCSQPSWFQGQERFEHSGSNYALSTFLPFGFSLTLTFQGKWIWISNDKVDSDEEVAKFFDKSVNRVNGSKEPAPVSLKKACVFFPFPLTLSENYPGASHCSIWGYGHRSWQVLTTFYSFLAGLSNFLLLDTPLTHYTICLPYSLMPGMLIDSPLLLKAVATKPSTIPASQVKIIKTIVIPYFIAIYMGEGADPWRALSLSLWRTTQA